MLGLPHQTDSVEFRPVNDFSIDPNNVFNIITLKSQMDPLNYIINTQ